MDRPPNPRRQEPFPPEVDHEIAQAAMDRMAQRSRVSGFVFPAVMLLAGVVSAVGPHVDRVGRGLLVAAIVFWVLLQEHHLLMTCRARRRQELPHSGGDAP